MVELSVSLIVVLISMMLMHRWYKHKVNQVSQRTHDFTTQIERLTRQAEATLVKSTFDKLSALLVASDPSAYYHVLLRIESTPPKHIHPEQMQHINEVITFFTQHTQVDFGVLWDDVFAANSLPNTLVYLWQHGQNIEDGQGHHFMHTKEVKITEMIDPRLIAHCHTLGWCPEKEIMSLSTQFFYRTYAIMRINTVLSALATVNAFLYQQMLRHSELPQTTGTFANGCFERITLDRTSKTQITFKVYLNSLSEDKDKDCLIRFHRRYDDIQQQYHHFTQCCILVDGQYQPLLADEVNIHHGLCNELEKLLDNSALKAFQLVDTEQE